MVGKVPLIITETVAGKEIVSPSILAELGDELTESKYLQNTHW